MSNFYFGKCVQNMSKNRFEINSMRFETLLETSFKKRVKKRRFDEQFNCGKCL